MRLRKLFSDLQWWNIFGLLCLPAVAAALAPWYILNHGLQWQEVAATFVLWCLTGLAITAGYHRMFSHRSWSAPFLVRVAFAIFGAAAWQNSIIRWATNHRNHHRYTDSDRDPYNSTNGFWYAHIGWALKKQLEPDDVTTKDLWADPVCKWQHRYYRLIGLSFNLLVPILLGAITGRIGGMLIFAGLLRIVIVHQCTFLINSACHHWGQRHFRVDDSARDNWVVAFFTFGEGYHNFHHSNPCDYRNGWRWFHFDPTKWVIWLMWKCRLADCLHRNTHKSVSLQKAKAFTHKTEAQHFQSKN